MLCRQAQLLQLQQLVAPLRLLLLLLILVLVYQTIGPKQQLLLQLE